MKIFIGIWRNNRGHESRVGNGVNRGNKSLTGGRAGNGQRTPNEPCMPNNEAESRSDVWRGQQCGAEKIGVSQQRRTCVKWVLHHISDGAIYALESYIELGIV